MNYLSGTPHVRLVRSAAALLLALSGVVATIGSAAPAQAQSVTVTDPRDPPPRGDISGATYTDRETSTTTLVHVRRLRSTGTLSTRIARPDSEVGYDAVVRAGPGGHVRTRLVHDTGTSRTTVACDVAASWSPGNDTIRVSVPQSCLRFSRFQTRHSFGTTLTAGSSHDAAGSRVVGRGGSPGCATAGEMRRVHRGQSLASVHAHLDTAGRFGDGGAGGFSRTYRACQGGHRYWVEYDGRSKEAVGKGRVS